MHDVLLVVFACIGGLIGAVVAPVVYDFVATLYERRRR